MIDPLQLLIAPTTKVVLVDDNAKSHARRERCVYKHNEKQSSVHCRWQSSPVSVRKPGLQSFVGKRGLPSSTITSLRSLVAPIQHRQRTVPLDMDCSSSSSSEDEEIDISDYRFTGKMNRHQSENTELNQKLTKASELLSEYLRVATEELCLDYDDDELTVGTGTTASTTVTSFSSSDSERSTRSLTRNVRKPVRQRSREDVLTEVMGC